MKASYHESGKSLEKQTSILGLQKLQNVDGIRIFGELWNAARLQIILKFNDIWCGSIFGPMLGPFDLGGLLWHHWKHFSRRKFRFRDAAAENCS